MIWLTVFEFENCFKLLKDGVSVLLTLLIGPNLFEKVVKKLAFNVLQLFTCPLKATHILGLSYLSKIFLVIWKQQVRFYTNNFSISRMVKTYRVKILMKFFLISRRPKTLHDVILLELFNLLRKRFNIFLLFYSFHFNFLFKITPFLQTFLVSLFDIPSLVVNNSELWVLFWNLI